MVFGLLENAYVGQQIEDKTKLKVKENCSFPRQPFLKTNFPQEKRGGELLMEVASWNWLDLKNMHL